MTGTVPEPSFLHIVQIHHLQAMLHLGLVPDPATGQARKPAVARARHEIVLLEILREKTLGNLTEDEEGLLDQVIASLTDALKNVRAGGNGGAHKQPTDRLPHPEKSRRIILPDDEPERDG